MRITPIILVLAAVPACGSRRIAGYLEDLENCSLSSSSSETDATHSSGPSEDAASSAGSAETTAGGSGTSTESTGTTANSSSTTEAIETTDTSTGEPAPICGNGVLEAYGPEPEECDDGNLVPDDGCGDTCALDRRVFVSSTLYDGAEVKSLYIADAFCANRADDQGWPEPQKYRAWLSDSMTDARDRLTQGRGRLVMANGLVLATSWSALLAGQVEHPLEVTEKNETYHGAVWTGTRPDGTAVPGAEHCGDWSSSSLLKTGHFGYSNRMMGEWTLADDPDQPLTCNLGLAIYCFQSL